MTFSRNFKIPAFISVLFGIDRLKFETRGISSIKSYFNIPTKFKNDELLETIKQEDIEKKVKEEARNIAKKVKEIFNEMNKAYFKLYPRKN